MTLAESQLIRFIDDINGVTSESIYAREKQLRKELRGLKRATSDKSIAVRIREIYQEINDILYIPEYLLLIIDKNNDYLRAVEGFTVNGRTYHRLLGTSGGIKLSTIVFIADTGSHGQLMREEILRRINNGRDMMKPLVPAKLEAYMGLVCSASTPVSPPNGVIVVPDCMTRFTSDYIQLSDGPDGGEPVMEYVKDGPVELDNSDGYGLISPWLMDIWSAELGESRTASGVCVRNAFCKGMLFPFDYVEFAQNVAHNYMVKDVWGVERNVLDADIILTESMLKLWDCYDSIESYMNNCEANGYTFSVTKVAEAKHQDSRELNYQFIQSYELTDDEIEELVAPTVDDISGVMGGDPAKSILYLKGSDQTENTIARSDDDFIKAMMINGSVLDDPYVRSRIDLLIRYRADRAKLGRVRVRGDFQVASGDPYALCQSMFGLEVTGLLQGGEIYSKYWVDRGVDEVVCFRAPMTTHENIRRMAVRNTDDMKHWYRYMSSVLITNAWDLMTAALNGMDYDGDSVLSTDNPILLRKTKNSPVIQCMQRKATKIIPTEADIVASNMVAFGDDIGTITNRATAMFDILATFDPDSAEAETMRRRIIASQHYQQNSINY